MVSFHYWEIDNQDRLTDKGLNSSNCSIKSIKFSKLNRKMLSEVRHKSYSFS